MDEATFENTRENTVECNYSNIANIQMYRFSNSIRLLLTEIQILKLWPIKQS